MSRKDTERVLERSKLDRRNMLLAGSTLAAASALNSTPGAADQAGASGAYSNSAIAMMPPGEPIPASKQERVLGAKIARAMLSGPRQITKDATVAEMGADGNLVVLRQGTNDWVCFPGDENEIGNVPMCAGLAVDDGCQSEEAKAHKYGPGSYLHAVWRHAAQQYGSVRQNKSSHPDWSSLDDHLAFRCQTLWPAQHRARRGCMGNVRRYSLRLSAYLRHAVGRK
jgi:hypothetical protein